MPGPSGTTGTTPATVSPCSRSWVRGSPQAGWLPATSRCSSVRSLGMSSCRLPSASRGSWATTRRRCGAIDLPPRNPADDVVQHLIKELRRNLLLRPVVLRGPRLPPSHRLRLGLLRALLHRRLPAAKRPAALSAAKRPQLL